MTNYEIVPGNKLTEALQNLGFDFLWQENNGEAALKYPPARLIEALAQSPEARLRMALIPLFLEYPEYSDYAQPAAARLSPAARLNLQCYYTAAVCYARLQSLAALPDLFGEDLGLELTDTPRTDLQRLAELQGARSNSPINWLGTYQHAVENWLRSKQARKN